MENLDLFALAKDMLSQIIAFLPNLLGALLILLLGWIMARFVRRIIQKVLTRIGLNSLSDQVNNMKLFGNDSKFQISLVHIISHFVYYFIMFVMWVIAAEFLGIAAIIQLLQDIIDYMPTLLIAFIYLLLGIILADLARKFVKTTLDSLGIPSAGLLAGFVFYFLVINILLGALTQARINTDFIADNISILIGGVVLAFAIGYGLASRSVAGNLIHSFYWKDKFKVGDQVEIEGITGTVQRIEKAHLVIRKDNDDIAIIPMNKVATNVVVLKKQA